MDGSQAVAEAEYEGDPEEAEGEADGVSGNYSGRTT